MLKTLTFFFICPNAAAAVWLAKKKKNLPKNTQKLTANLPALHKMADRQSKQVSGEESAVFSIYRGGDVGGDQNRGKRKMTTGFTSSQMTSNTTLNKC